jgi:hypothetical protein
MGGGGGSQKSTTTTSIDPRIAPYVTYGLQEAQRLYQGAGPRFFEGQNYVSPSEATSQSLDLAKQRAIGGSPLIKAAQQETLDTIAGRGVNPFLAGALEGVNRQAGQDFTKNIEALRSNASAMGRYGSSAQGQQEGLAQDIFARNLAEAGNRMAYNSAEAERARQVAASQYAPQMANADYMDIEKLLRVGQAGESYDQAKLQADMARFNYNENLPQMKLQNFANVFSNVPQGSTTTQTATPTGGK